jgi:hypothetical protein
LLTHKDIRKNLRQRDFFIPEPIDDNYSAWFLKNEPLEKQKATVNYLSVIIGSGFV